MAEGLLRYYSGDAYEVHSGGTDPLGLNPIAIKVMQEIGIDISGRRSKSINEFNGEAFDGIITFCDKAKASCPFFPSGIVIHKGFSDPSESQESSEPSTASIRKIRDEIKEWIIDAFRD
jgi:arsenate reductase